MKYDGELHPDGQDAAWDADFDVDAELAKFEAEERTRLGIEPEIEHWYDKDAHPTFSKDATKELTILSGGLSIAQDFLIQGAMQGAGYRFIAIDTPDNDAFRLGKEFGNRGQCNPTYFTVGNLVKYLLEMEQSGVSKQEIIENYVFMTAGACGPCRFGMYITEYRKALRDAGFEGFRCLLFEQTGGIEDDADRPETEKVASLDLSGDFYIALIKGAVIGDILNLVSHRIRPYEVEEGATDKAMEAAKQVLYDTLRGNSSLLIALLKAQREFARVKVDRTRVKPMVHVIGEFWAMTTEGDGNYHMHSFLEEEGAEVEVQILTTWILFLLWESARDIKQRLDLRGVDEGQYGLISVAKPYEKWLKLKAADLAARVVFHGFGKLLGLFQFELSNIEELAKIASDFYHTELRGGKAYLEVAKLIFNAAHSKANLTLSLKPFGCMPSSGVSDGVQSSITELYPESLFLPIETSGDNAVGVYSRVQMMLFKAKKAAQKDVDEALADYEMSMEEVQSFLAKAPFLQHPLFQPPHVRACTAANTVELVGMIKKPWKAAKLWWARRQQQSDTYRQAPHKVTLEATLPDEPYDRANRRLAMTH